MISKTCYYVCANHCHFKSYAARSARKQRVARTMRATRAQPLRASASSAASCSMYSRGGTLTPIRAAYNSRRGGRGISSIAAARRDSWFCLVAAKGRALTATLEGSIPCLTSAPHPLDGRARHARMVLCHRPLQNAAPARSATPSPPILGAMPAETSSSAGDGKAFNKYAINGVGWVTNTYRGYNTFGTTYAQAPARPIVGGKYSEEMASGSGYMIYIYRNGGRHLFRFPMRFDHDLQRIPQALPALVQRAPGGDRAGNFLHPPDEPAVGPGPDNRVVALFHSHIVPISPRRRQENVVCSP